MLARVFFTSSLLLATGAMAQSSSSSGPTNVAGPDGNLVSVQVVQVSDMNATLKYYPEQIEAEAGSLVQFQFYPKNHTVTQSTFDNPCEPINKIMSNVTGINSGPMPPENNMMKVFTIMINDTKPIWMYCATKSHCQKGMAMVINAPAGGSKTLANYKAAAAKLASTNSSTTPDGGNSTSGNGSSTPAPGGASSVVNSMLGSTGIGALLVAAFVLLL